MQTYMANPDKIERKWYVVDAEGCTLGRLASGVASVLRGKNKPQFTPHVDTGDYVIVVNADKIKVTGKKLEQKIYYNHSDLLHSCPDTVHRFLLRKTQTSTPLIKGCSARYKPQIGITPAVADCRYRAPLSPRLRISDYIGRRLFCQ